MKQLLTLMLGIFIYSNLLGQAVIQGKIVDEKTGEELIAAVLTIYQNEKIKTGVTTDFDGDYTLTLKPGAYEIEASYVGYRPRRDKVIISPEEIKTFNISLGGPLILDEIFAFDCGPKAFAPSKKDVTCKTIVTSKDIPVFFSNIKNSITGKVTSRDTKENLIAANVSIYKNGILQTGTTTDLEGNYHINLDPGSYEMEFSYIGYETERQEGVLVSIEETQILDIQMESGFNLEEIVVLSYKALSIEHSGCILSCCTACRKKATQTTEEKNEVSSVPLLHLKTYPNPTTDLLNIQLDQTVDYLILRSINGKELNTYNNVNTGLIQINVSDFPAGTYVVQIGKDELKHAEKVLVIRQ